MSTNLEKRKYAQLFFAEYATRHFALHRHENRKVYKFLHF